MLLLIAAAQFAWQARVVARGAEFCACELTVDDTYYYLQTAWNMKHLGFPSFDGINRTNGVQFLWYWIVAGIAAVSPSRPALLAGTLLVCAALNAACYYPMWRIGRRLGRPWIAVGMALCWFYITTHNYLLGMENSLNALLVCAVLANTLNAVGEVERPAGLGAFVPTLLLCLLVWSRLDQALIALPIASLLLWAAIRVHGGDRGAFGRVGGNVLLAGLLFGVLLTGFRWMGGTWLPISGSIKQQTYSWSLSYLWKLLAKSLEASFPPTTLLEYASFHGMLQGELPLQLLLAGFGLAAFTLTVSGQYWRSLRTRYTRAWYLVFALPVLLHFAYLAGLHDFAMYGVWYLSPFNILVALTAGFCLDAAIGLLGRGRAAVVMGAIACAVTMVCSGLELRWNERNSRGYRQGEFYAQVQLARWVDAHIDAGTTCAAWNAGLLGYFCHRPVINLDGLINDRDFYETVLKGKLPLLEYLRSEGVAYVIDDEECPEVQRASTAVASFPIPGYTDGRRKYVWRLPWAPTTRGE